MMHWIGLYAAEFEATKPCRLIASHLGGTWRDSSPVMELPVIASGRCTLSSSSSDQHLVGLLDVNESLLGCWVTAMVVRVSPAGTSTAQSRRPEILHVACLLCCS